MVFAKNFERNYEKKIMLGTSDAWSMSPMDPASQRIILKIVGFLNWFGLVDQFRIH